MDTIDKAGRARGAPQHSACVAVQEIIQPMRLRLTGFFRHEDGSIIPFSLMMLMMMLMMGGFALDLMRHEEKRTLMQQTLDRSVLAAASMQQTLDPEDVLRDYFDKADLTQYLSAVNVDEGLNFRSVGATAIADTDPFFMHMVGVDQFNAAAGSQAEQRINNVEIALVLDVSRSMKVDDFGNFLPLPNKMDKMEDAAQEFIQTILENGDDRISLSIVPYNAQVNLGSQLMARYNVSYTHTTANSKCLDIPTSAYTSTSLSSSTAIPQAPYADIFSTAGWYDAWYYDPVGPYFYDNAFLNVACVPHATNIIHPPSDDIDELTDHIEALEAVGGTAIDLGMKWGITMLDPGSRAVLSPLVDSKFNNRPLAYDPTNVMKVIVLMTDGQNSASEQLAASFRTQQSNIYRNSTDGRYSIRFTTGRPASAGNNQYWVPHLNNGQGAWRSGVWRGDFDNGTTTRLTWYQVWSELRVQWVAWHLYARALGHGNSDAFRTQKFTDQMNVFRARTEAPAVDTRLQQVCSAAKAQNVIVFGIAFEAPTNGRTQIQNCATSSAHFFNATGEPGLSIRTAFRAIASQISTLRLTQ